jgi:hypothetical protein
MEETSKIVISVGAAVATGVACYYMGFQNGSSTRTATEVSQVLKLWIELICFFLILSHSRHCRS